MKKIGEWFIIIVTALTLPSIIKEVFPNLLADHEVRAHIICLIFGILIGFLNSVNVHQENNLLFRLKAFIFNARHVAKLLLAELLIVLILSISAVAIHVPASPPPSGLLIYSLALILVFLLVLLVNNKIPFRGNHGPDITVHYDGSKPGADDVNAANGMEFDKDLGKDAGPISQGSFAIVEDAFSITRLNDEGRFKLTFVKYNYNGSSLGYIAVNPLLTITRKFRITCEFRSVQGVRHTLRFALVDLKTHAWKSNRSIDLVSTAWDPREFYLEGPYDINLLFRVDDVTVAAFPSTVQIRNLKIMETV